MNHQQFTLLSNLPEGFVRDFLLNRLLEDAQDATKREECFFEFLDSDRQTQIKPLVLSYFELSEEQFERLVAFAQKLFIESGEHPEDSIDLYEALTTAQELPLETFEPLLEKFIFIKILQEANHGGKYIYGIEDQDLSTMECDAWNLLEEVILTYTPYRKEWFDAEGRKFFDLESQE